MGSNELPLSFCAGKVSRMKPLGGCEAGPKAKGVRPPQPSKKWHLVAVGLTGRMREDCIQRLFFIVNSVSMGVRWGEGGGLERVAGVCNNLHVICFSS